MKKIIFGLFIFLGFAIAFLFTDIGVSREYIFINRETEESKKKIGILYPNELFNFEQNIIALYKGDSSKSHGVFLGKVLVQNKLFVPKFYHDQPLVLCFGEKYKPMVVSYEPDIDKVNNRNFLITDGMFPFGTISKSLYVAYKPSELGQYVSPTTTYTNEAVVYVEEAGDKLCGQLERRTALNNFEVNILELK